MKLKIKKLHPDAIIPECATVDAACFDLHAVGIEEAYASVTASQPRTFDTGLAFEIPRGYAMLVFSRSGHGFKNGVHLANAVGVIDPDYRGPVRVRLEASPFGHLAVKNGDRIAQATLVSIPRVEFEEVEELSDTTRGAGGFGSTGS